MNTFSVKLGDLLGIPYSPGEESEAAVQAQAHPDIEMKQEKMEQGSSKIKKVHKIMPEKKREERSMSTKSGANIQDQFLNHMRREKTPITVHLLGGTEIHGHIKSFDNFCIQIESAMSGETLIYKHGITCIKPSQVGDYNKKV